jgi:outer membrane protein TolC
MDREARRDVRRLFRWYVGLAAFLPPAVSGCVDLSSLRLSHPSVAPATQPDASLKVDASQIPPMYRRLLAVDLPTVARVAMARNLDIQEAQQRVNASRGEYESSVGAIFPSITPNLTAVGIQGAVAKGGGIGLATLQHVTPAVLLQWIINPGQVAYDVVASKRRLEASAQEEQAVALETTRVAAVQYYDLVLAQAQVSVARQAMNEAEELLRIERLRLRTGTGLPADELRAEAALAGTQQALLTALNGFYDASVALTVTLHLDSTVMLVPRAGTMTQTTLVREDLTIDNMLVTAVRYRTDLQAVRTLWAAAEADKGAAVWGGLGPQIQAARTFAPRPPTGEAVDTIFRQPRYVVTGGFNWSAATFGRIKSAVANVELAGLDVDRQLDQVRAAVVSAHQASLTAAKLIPIATQQVASAGEALRLTQANLKAGTGLTIDVLQAEDAADQARLRYATAMVGYNQSQINLLAALGLIDQMNVAGKPTAAPTLGVPMDPSGSAPK